MDERIGGATLAHRNLARLVLQIEVERGGESADLFHAAEAACEKLSACFAPIVTRAGTEALLSRALFLSRLDFPLLSGVAAGGAGEPCLNGLRQALRVAEHAETTETILAVLANVIALLSVFIGDDLVRRKLNATWPGAVKRTGLSQEEA